MLHITMRNGETHTIMDDEWDDYAYDGRAFIVLKDGRWVAIYNFDEVKNFRYEEVGSKAEKES